VYSVDLPGLGSTQAPDKVWGLDEYAQFLQHFVKKVGAGNLYAIIGHSNGGAIAIRGIAHGELAADKLVLLSSAGVRDTKRTRKLALKMIAKAGKVATMPLPPKTRNRIRRRFYRSIKSDLLVVEHMQATFKKVVSQDVQADAAKIIIPTLLIYGHKDIDTPPAYGKLFASQLHQATLHEVKDAGHFIHHDQPALVDDLVGDFLHAA
jgi:pimeloyl-ACP methyl ester carboxylesterase